MEKDQFYMWNNVLYQWVEAEDENYSIPTLILDDQVFLDTLLIIVKLLMEIYERAESVKFLQVIISLYMVEIDDDVILIYPYDFEKGVQNEFLEILNIDLYILYHVLNAQICDAK